MKDFEYAAAATLEEAVGLLSARGERAKLLVGGTDLLVQLREGLRQADLVIDVKKIPELTRMQMDANGSLVLGAAVPCSRIYEDEQTAKAFPGLVDAARIIGGWQIQSRASIGGNLCNSSPAADSIPVLIAYGAQCLIAGAQGALRKAPVEEFCTAPGRNQLQRGELLVSIVLPVQAAGSGAAYLRFIPRNEMDIAVVGVGTWMKIELGSNTIRDARIGLGAIAPTPVLAAEASAWLAGKPADAETFAQAGELAKKSASPISDKRGTAEYRTHLVGVLTRRTLAIAAGRARGETEQPNYLIETSP